MRVAIVGYGRMGHEVERQAVALGLQVSRTIDTAAQLRQIRLAEDELVVEFSQPGAVLSNLQWLMEQGAKVVCGTTGWYQHLPQVRQWVEGSPGALLYGANFSLGVQLFWLLCQQAAQLFNHFSSYDVYLHEAHHRHKLDAPSGTALKAAELVLQQLPRKKRIVTSLAEGGLQPEDLHVGISRGGAEPGRHTLCFDGEHEQVTITHQARSRASFAHGALLAGLWLFPRQGLYSVDDYLQHQLQHNRENPHD